MTNETPRCFYAHYGTGSGGGQWELANEYVDDDGNIIDVPDIVRENDPKRTNSYFLIQFDFEGETERHKLEQKMPLRKERSHARYVSEGHTNPNWVVASMLLMPKPRSKKTGTSLTTGPLPTERGYWIEYVTLDVDGYEHEEFTFIPDIVMLESLTGETKKIETSKRLERIYSVCFIADRGISKLDDLLCDFREMVFGSVPFVANECQKHVNGIMHEIAKLDSRYNEGEDCLKYLESYYGLRSDDGDKGSSATINPESIPRTDISERLDFQERMTLRADRGAAGKRFARLVANAYDSTCAVCGIRLPRTTSTKIGVEAAHILPWAATGLNDINNGVCLCRFHHWAFDTRIIKITFENGEYVVDKGPFFDAFIEAAGPGSDNNFGILPYTINRNNLPNDASMLPSPAYLAEFNDYID